jgi:hypothetical protein
MHTYEAPLSLLHTHTKEWDDLTIITSLENRRLNKMFWWFSPEELFEHKYIKELRKIYKDENSFLFLKWSWLIFTKKPDDLNIKCPDTLKHLIKVLEK